MLSKLKVELKSLANKEQAHILQRFFKTSKGEYGEGDIFLGLNSQQIKEIVKAYDDLDLKEIQELLNSKIHEHRICGIRILVSKYNKLENKKQIFDFYIKNSKRINNWDLVDLSAPNIVGDYLLDKPRDILHILAKSSNLWEKRIAIISTYTFIKNNQFDDTLEISKILLSDSHDLIHKAVGWMLREVGKKDQKILEEFLIEYYKKIPRTTLRYAIERFVEKKRKRFLLGEFN
ncbi:MAG: DNA alkylation repair protein [archaeon]